MFISIFALTLAFSAARSDDAVAEAASLLQSPRQPNHVAPHQPNNDGVMLSSVLPDKFFDELFKVTFMASDDGSSFDFRIHGYERSMTSSSQCGSVVALHGSSGPVTGTVTLDETQVFFDQQLSEFAHIHSRWSADSFGDGFKARGFCTSSDDSDDFDETTCRTTTTTTVSPYKAWVGQNHCGVGYHFIRTEADCIAAALQLGVTYTNARVVTNRPSGCYRQSKGQKHWETDRVIYNTHETGASAKSAYIICKLA